MNISTSIAYELMNEGQCVQGFLDFHECTIKQHERHGKMSSSLVQFSIESSLKCKNKRRKRITKEIEKVSALSMQRDLSVIGVGV